MRRGLGDGHRRGRPGGLRLPAHAAAPPQQAAARAAAGGEDRRARRGRPGRYQEVLGADGTRRVFRAVLTDNGAEFSDEAAIAALLGEGRARRGCSTATPGAATRRAPASATTSRSGSCCPRAPESGSTGLSRPTWRWPCRT